VSVVVDGGSLTREEVVRVARGSETVELAPGVEERMADARALVERVLARGDRVYGLTTGVGMRKRFGVALEEQTAFNRMLVLNHRTGQGPPVAADVVRAAMLRLANALASGSPGVRPELAERLVRALNDGAEPVVRSLGSLGQADLPQAADLAHELFTDLELEAKEGIGLLNTNCFATGAAALAVDDAFRLADALDVAGALDLEAFAANLTILHPRVREVRPYPGLVQSLTRLREMLHGSSLWEPGTARNLQDPLTFRNVAHVHGALRDALAYVESVVATELNAAQENPLAVPAEDRIVSVANYEILPLAAALDFLRIALAPALTSAAERGVKLLQAAHTGLTEGLAPRSGLVENSLSEFGVPVQSLAAEARLLAAPVSYDVVSTSHAEGIEDRMTMAPLAARRTAEMIGLGERVVAVALVVACQAVDLRGAKLGTGTRRVYERVRERVPFMAEGETIPQDVQGVVDLVRAGDIS
jgi:histidine ammonia-lyase